MSNTVDNEAFRSITEQALDELRRRIGGRITPSPEPWCHEVTRDNVRHHAHGIGDDNPLWCDPDYAQATRHGGLLAPPSFLFACSRSASGYVGGLPGVHAMWAGANWIWHQWPRRRNGVTAESWLRNLIPHETRFAGRAIEQVYHVNFFNQAGDRLAEVDSWVFRTERDTAREKGTKSIFLHGHRGHRFQNEELREVWRLSAEEEIRESRPRHWENVEVGESLPMRVKGPMTITGFIAHAQGWGGLYIRAHKLAWKQQLQHPFLDIPNHFNVTDCPERVHWVPEFAWRVGAPGASDLGPERCSWLTHQITNWMGDDGFLAASNTQIRRRIAEGEVLHIHAAVKSKLVDQVGRHCVVVDQRAVTLDDEESILGAAAVVLPSRA